MNRSFERESKIIEWPKVSVIVPVYNVEEYLPQCLGSIVGQSYKNLEIICVNDGSVDSSGCILDRFCHIHGGR